MTQLDFPEASATCAQCGAPLRPGARFCGACGAPRAEGAAEPEEAKRAEHVKPAEGRVVICPKCSHASPAGTKFCRRCGAEAGAGSDVVGEGSPQEAPAGEPPKPAGEPAKPSGEPRKPAGRSSGPGGPGQDRPKWLPVAGGVVLLLAAGGLAALLFSGGGGGAGSQTSATASTPTGAEPAGAGSAAAEEIGATVENGARASETEAGGEEGSSTTAPSAMETPGAVLSVLREYEAAYSEASGPAIAAVLTGDVVRHGLRAGGCSTETGKSAVLDAYRSQFSQDGPVVYELVGLSAGDVRFLGEHEARVETSYSIPEANNSGSISFALVNVGGGWRIDEVDATCNPR